MYDYVEDQVSLTFWQSGSGSSLGRAKRKNVETGFSRKLSRVRTLSLWCVSLLQTDLISYVFMDFSLYFSLFIINHGF